MCIANVWVSSQSPSLKKNCNQYKNLQQHCLKLNTLNYCFIEKLSFLNPLEGKLVQFKYINYEDVIFSQCVHILENMLIYFFQQ